MQHPTKARFTFGPFLLDPVEKTLSRGGQPIHLPPKAFQTLLALVENDGHLLEKEYLLSLVWPNTFVEEATLAQNIFVLRKALGDSSDGDEYIETVPKRGYRFVAPVHQAEVPAFADTTVTRRLPHRRIIWLLAIGFLILIGVAGLSVWRRSRSPRIPPLSKIMLAVLPLENLSGNPAQDYFCDGLTEQLVTDFGSLSPDRLGVIARTTMMQYKNTQKNLAQIGNELKVDYVLEGSVAREREHLRIDAQLIRVQDQTHVWAETYERDLGGALALQNDVASEISKTVSSILAPPSPARNASRQTLNPAAYEAYLQGRYFWNKRSEQGHLKAIEYFNQAIAEDPEYARAYSGLADAYALLGSNPNTRISRQAAMEKARSAALKALALDDTLAEAHTSLAFVYWHYDWNWPLAEKEFTRAVHLNPSYPTAHHWYALYLLSQGRIEQALEEIRIAQRTDPLSLIINTDVAEVLLLSKQYDQGVEQARKVLEMEPRFSAARLVLTWCLLKKGATETALREAKNGYELAPEDPDMVANLAIAYAASGDVQSSRAILRQAEAQANRRPMDPILIGLVQAHALLNDKNEAFAMLERDLWTRNGGLTLIKLLPFLDSLHDDSRYSSLIRQIGLPP